MEIFQSANRHFISNIINNMIDNNFNKFILQMLTVFLCILTILCEFDGVGRKCIPLDDCPLARSLVYDKNKKYNTETISYLKSVHCGYKKQFGAMVYCDITKDCITPDAKEGVCKPIYECDSFIDLLQNNSITRNDKKNYLRKNQCSNEFCMDEVHICCSENIGSIKGKTEFRQRQLPDPNKQECGIQKEDFNKIINGNEADLGEYPWMALLLYEYKNGTTSLSCAGSLISSRYVLTAAHCLHKELLEYRNIAKVKQVVLGEHDIRNKTDCFYTKFGAQCADPPQYIDVESILIHKLFNRRFASNDIGLVRLSEDVKFTDFVRPICLPTKSDTLEPNTNLLIAGWGKTIDTAASMSPVKMKATVKYQNSTSCISALKLTEGQICAGEFNGKDTCFGDSGGPLMIPKVIKTDVVSFLYGITSYGAPRCGSEPSVFTFVPRYVDWINENIQ